MTAQDLHADQDAADAALIESLAGDQVLVTPEAGPGRTLLIEASMALAALNALHEWRARDLIERAMAVADGDRAGRINSSEH